MNKLILKLTRGKYSFDLELFTNFLLNSCSKQILYPQKLSLESKRFVQLLNGFFWICNWMSDCSLISVDFMIVAALLALISPKVDHVIAVFNKFKAEWLIPSLREDVKGDLTADGELEIQIGKLLSESLHESLAHSSCSIVLLELVALVLRTISAYWTYIHHSISEFDECSSTSIEAQKVRINESNNSAVALTSWWECLDQRCSAE